MSENNAIQCLILGSGPAGYTAAIYAARAGMKPILYTGPQIGGQLTITGEVENYPGYPDGVSGPEMMEHFKKQAERFETEIRYGYATAVDFSQYPFKVTIDGKTEVTAKSVIISTGASAKWLGLKNEERLNGSGVSACAVCDGFFFRKQDVVVVGGGDTACEEASYLSKLCNKVYLLVRGTEMRASKIMQKRVEMTENIEILYQHETVDILGENSVEGVQVVNKETGEERVINATGFFVAIGHKPNTDIFKGQLDLDQHGYILTKPGTTQTNIRGVFAAGDAQDSVYRQAITAAGTGCMAALESERFLAEKEME